MHIIQGAQLLKVNYFTGTFPTIQAKKKKKKKKKDAVPYKLFQWKNGINSLSFKPNRIHKTIHKTTNNKGKIKLI